MAADKHIRFDWAIKRLLRQKSNFGILEGFISELLMEDITIQEIIESESNKEYSKDKFNRVDILVKSSTDELMLIEVQNEREHDYFHRMNYGQAKLTTEHIATGENYDKIKKVFSINIVYFELGQGEDYIYKGRTVFKGIHQNDILNLSQSQKKVYTKANEIADIFTTYYLIKVNKFNNIATSTLDEWIYFLKNSEIKDSFKAKGLKEAKEKMRTDNLEGYDKEEYDNYIKTQRIKMGEIKTAVFDAKQELEKIINQKKKIINQNKKIINQNKKIINQKEEVINQKEEVINQKEEVINQKEEVINQKEELINQKEEVINQKEELIKQERQKAEEKEIQLIAERQKAEQKEIQLVKGMKKDGMSIDLISKYTNLSIEKIKTILAQ